MLWRHITETVTAALRDTPVVLLVGPRQAGKSTLAQTFVPPDRYLTLEEATTLAAAQRDPTGFLAPFDELTVIDEVQRAPDLLLAVMSRREAVHFVDGGITAAAREDSVKSLLDAAVSAITRAASEELPRVGELLQRLRERDWEPVSTGPSARFWSTPMSFDRAL